MARSSFDGETWKWGGARGRNSISDAEQLLCLIYPASTIPSFKLDIPDQTAEDVLVALGALGDSVEIPKRLVRVLTEYMRTYRDESGAPIFAGGTYFRPDRREAKVSAEQQALHVVEAFSISVTLTIATIGFVKVFRTQLTRKDLREEVSELEALASTRLTAAMVGLLRSFTVNVFEPSSIAGRALSETVNQTSLPDRKILENLQEGLREVKAGLRDLTIGSGQVEVDLDNPNLLFDCGWSWGVVKDAPPVKVETGENIGPQPPGVAQKHPSLYFTVNALAGLADLHSERTRVLGLLNDEQQRLAAALQIRWDLTRQYWATIASFGRGRWPLEDIPWRTNDREESDYFTLLVTSLVAQDLQRRGATDSDLARVYRVLAELATRARISRRPGRVDPAVALHTDGVPLRLGGSEELGPSVLNWVVADFGMMLLKRVITVALQAQGLELRRELMALTDDTWDHLYRRRLRTGSERGLWDQPSQVFPGTEEYDRVSWSHTERIVESLVEMSQLAAREPLRSEMLSELAMDLLSEAEQLFDQESLLGSLEAGPAIRSSMHRIQANLRRAREVVQQRPGTAFALTTDVLRQLDQLTAAREDAGTM